MKKTNVKPMSISTAMEEVLRVGCKNKTEAIKSVFELLKKAGVVKTKAGNVLDEKIVHRQINAACFDIKKGKGKWVKYKLVNTDNLFKVVLKA